ncbi:MAG: VanZ family protein, partial [Firmicutes bacterium]|nr:VanZ family protein [Bacillota bacterium]
YLYSLLAGIAAACIDETIQIFVPGRGPGIADVGIDTLGVTLGIVFISLIQQIKKNKSKHLEENKL